MVRPAGVLYFGNMDSLFALSTGNLWPHRDLYDLAIEENPFVAFPTWRWYPQGFAVGPSHGDGVLGRRDPQSF
jgi:hypothetical protein